MIDIDYSTLADEVESGAFRTRLEAELIRGFHAIHEAGERLPPSSYYAAKIAAIVAGGSAEPLAPELAFDLYQEILAACEGARLTVLGEPPSQ